MEQARQDKAVGSVRVWEVVTAVVFLLVGALVIFDSRRLGSTWDSDGPQAGYFPFYIGVIICVSSLVNLVSALMNPANKDAPFVTWGQMRMVLIVMVPYSVYVVLIANPVYSLGIYEASVIFIAAFMRYLGKYSWLKIAVISVVTMVAFFIMFEVWFKVPLPKGPIEALLGFL
ncbi:MAG: tripartite tricarboxylate transporter TctB family protein [Usitatibacter sp.]